jgi:AcrR family transcriptional regulator
MGMAIAADQKTAPRRSRRDERKEETRAELIEAAAKVFARRGFHGASVEQIAAEAGYSTGALYWHFHGKDDLFLAVYEDQAASRTRDVEAFAARAEGALPQRARAFAEQFMARAEREPEFLILSLEFLVHAWRNPPLREAFGQRREWGRRAAERLLEDEADRGNVKLPMPARDLAAVMRELGTGLGMARLADPGLDADIYADFVELFFEMVLERGKPSARQRQAPRRKKRSTAS